MDPKEQKPQDVKPTPAPVAQPVKAAPCATQVKEYQECLNSLSYYLTSCRKQQDSFKACPEFNSWLQSSVKKQQ